MTSRSDWLGFVVVAGIVAAFFTFAVSGFDASALVNGKAGPDPAQTLMGESYWR